MDTLTKEQVIEKGVEGLSADSTIARDNFKNRVSDTLNTLEDYFFFFTEAWGIKDLQSKLNIIVNPSERYIDLSNMTSPSIHLDLGNYGIGTTLKRIFNLLKIKIDNYDGKKVVSNKRVTKEIFKALFERFGYTVEMGKEESEKKPEIETLDGYMEYFQTTTGKEDLENAGVIIDIGEKTFNLSKLKKPIKFQIYGYNSFTRLKRILNLLRDEIELSEKEDTAVFIQGVRTIKLAKRVFAEFFKSFGYKEV